MANKNTLFTRGKLIFKLSDFLKNWSINKNSKDIEAKENSLAYNHSGNPNILPSIKLVIERKEIWNKLSDNHK